MKRMTEQKQIQKSKSNNGRRQLKDLTKKLEMQQVELKSVIGGTSFKKILKDFESGR